MAEGRGARTGSTGVGPTRQPHGPRWTGCTRLAPAGAVGPTRQPHPRARAADGRAPHGSRGARPKAATPAQPTGGGAPAPRWSPPVTTGAAERRPREGREGGSETAVHGSPRVDGGDGNGDRSGGRRRHGSDGDGGVPAVGGRNEGVDEVDEDAAKPKEAMPKREEVRGDGGGEPKLGGDGGERGRRRELDSDGERKRQGLREDFQTNPREREREKWGERGRESRGVISPSLWRAGTAGCGGFGGGGGARARAGGGSGGSVVADQTVHGSVRPPSAWWGRSDRPYHAGQTGLRPTENFTTAAAHRDLKTHDSSRDKTSIPSTPHAAVPVENHQDEVGGGRAAHSCHGTAASSRGW
uniref:DUF834 domain-containing protein n=1 Tax=Oryza sativa subsp. japonica TaxID=39947 RepID=Q60EN0_ORYSJ|nr:hypothetical protein [Oryza sativa Japonica Group]